MHMIPGYIIGQELYASRNTVVCRAIRQRDNAPVILKSLRDSYPTPERLAWFRREYDLTRSLSHLPGIAQVYGLEQHPTGWVMVFEDKGGDSLAKLGLAGTLSVPAFLRLALELTRILGHVHQQRVIHKDINPANIVYKPDTEQLYLIDFGLASRLSRGTTTFLSVTVPEGTLRYLPPEQTGRMNRPVDYRSDFYALGVTFYELLTGETPFTSDDALELIHSHIARSPTPPHGVKPGIPTALSDIILKLLAKDADGRYQSAHGIQADLEHCLHEFEASGTISSFPLAQHDVSDHFALPQKLYGREQELATLLGQFEQVAMGGNALLLVAGNAGIGKSALVQEIYRPLTERRGSFIVGHFDQRQRSVPYVAFAQAFRGLVHRILTEPESVLSQWRQRLKEALGVNGHVVVEIIPDLALLIGDQPPVPELGPQEAQNRFLLVFQNFLRVFTRSDHPLVLFLDDMQWADSSSLKLLEQILGSTEGGYLFVIGAYRDTEVPSSHPLWATLETIRQAGIEPQTLTLTPLDNDAVLALVRDMLHVDADVARPLAALIHRKTGGNPFFLGEFLKALYVGELLVFDTGQGCWTWDLSRIEKRQITDNVVQVMIEQVQRLPEQTQQTLQSAACIGSHFDLTTLAAVLEQSPTITAQQLEPALQERLVEPLGTAYQVMTLDVEGLTDAVQVDYRFTHDRVQQAAYQQVPASERPTRHWRIGQLMLTTISAEQRSERLFDLVNQLNAGRTLANDDERLELAQINLEAGRKAKDSAAFASASTLFQVGLELLPTDAWETHYPLALALHEHAAEAAYLSGDYKRMERLAETVVARAHNVLDTAKVHEAWIQSLTIQARRLEAVHVGLKILARLGLHLPDQPEPADIARILRETWTAVSETSTEYLENAPAITDPASLAICRILVFLCSPSFDAMPLLFPLIVGHLVMISAKQGNAPESPFGYTTYGILLCSVVGDIDTGYRYGRLGMQLATRFESRHIQCKTALTFLHVSGWKEHFREVVTYSLPHSQVGLDTGDLEYASWILWNASILSFFAGVEIGTLIQDTESRYHAIQHLQQPAVLQRYAATWQTLSHLRTLEEHPWMLKGTIYDEDEMLPLHHQENDGGAIFFLSLYKLILAYLFEAPDQLDVYATTVEQSTAYVPGFAAMAVANFYVSLARLRLYTSTPAEEQPALLAKVEASQQQLHTWAQYAPMNYQHRWHLVEAERCRVVGNDDIAWGHYQRAIDGAREQQFIQDEALAHELLGRFFLARGQEDEALLALHRAHRTYANWGAPAKTQYLEQCYPPLGLAAIEEARRPTTSASYSSSSHPVALDFASIVKAFQAITGEMQLEALLKRLLLVMLENAGADRGMLLLSPKDQWVVEAEGGLDGEVTVLHSLPLAQAALPQSIINYVLRTGESVVLDDAPVTGAFTQDSYIQSQKPHSVMAMPLLHQGKRIGLLYLENTRTAGAFTLERQEILFLLCGQVAISLENARLYTSMQDQVAARTHEVEERTRELNEAQQQVIDAQQRAILELSTPLIPITDSVVTMPLIGTIDTTRAQQVMETLLEGVARTRATMVIMDITGVGMVDSQVANALLQAVQAVRLLGADVVLTGIQPSVAQTLVHLGIDMSNIVARGTLQAGIAYALQHTNKQQEQNSTLAWR